MGKVILVVLVVVLVVVLGGGKCEGKTKMKQGYEKAANCEKLECPLYKVIYSEKEYEIRSYKNATWMSTSPTNSISYKDAADKGFLRLLDYIQGNNSLEAKIDITAPVIVDIYPPTEPFYNSSFVVNLYVPKKYQKNPPKAEQVHPMMLPKHHYAAVRRFGGFMDDSNIPTQALALRQSLKGTAWEYSSSSKQKMLFYSVAAYNSPFDKGNRVNEVIMWFDK